MLASHRFDQLARPHLPGLRQLALRLARDPAEAEDVLQDALMAGLRRLSSLRDEEAFRTWMARIVRTTHLDRARGRDRERRRAEAVGDGVILRFPGPAERLADRRLGTALERALDDLPAAQREAIWLVDALGHTFAEAAAALGIKSGTVASRVARARARLRVDLAAHARDRGMRP